MMMEERHADSESRRKRNIVQITNPMLYDRLHTLSVEYSVSEEMLVNIAVKRLLDDVELVRDLRSGRIKPEQDSNYCLCQNKKRQCAEYR